ncbi:MAG TPA: CRISPR-associated endonuclease Cas1 [Chthonomonadales bacterium]|nr:CRISPR-associated endonuclease Cas1 [Chthonomonadales bacterium]
MITVYVREQGAILRRTGGRLQITMEGRLLDEMRLADVERVALFGHVEITSAAMAGLLEAGIETTLLSASGRYRGRLAPAEGKNVLLRHAQFHRYSDTAFRLRIARAVVMGKIRNARYMVLRHHYNHPDPALAETAELLNRRCGAALQQQSIAGLMGVEGESARVYFSSFGKMLRCEHNFKTRSRRPPLDPVNASLSFGYSLLTAEITGAAAAQGLDPSVGLLHDLDYGRPSLSLDLLEELRQPVIDRLVLALFNLKTLQPAHFEEREGGVYLNEAGRPRFIEMYHRAMDTEFEDKAAGERATFRGVIRRQARRMRESIESQVDYVPFEPR